MQAGKLTNESEGVKWYAFVTIIAGVLLVVLWVQWLNSRMGGSSRREWPHSTPLLQLTPEQEPDTGHSGMATPYQLGAKPTHTPLPTVTPYRLGPTRTPRPAPTLDVAGTPTSTPPPVVAVTRTPTSTVTPDGRLVWVYLTTYWPDDGPDWCLTWNAATERCVSSLTSGNNFRLFEGQALACDSAWLGQTLTIPALGLELPCLDTGQSFRCVGGPCTVGLLSQTAEFAEGAYDGRLFAH